MANELVVYDQDGGHLALQRAPAMVLEEAHVAAKALMSVVSQKKDALSFNGKTYLALEDWQTLGKFYGVTAKIEATNYVQYGTVAGFEAMAVAVDSTGRVLSRAEAMCLNDEDKWGSRPKYEWRDILDANGKKIWDASARDGKGGYKREKIHVEDVPTPLYELRSMAQTRACSKVFRLTLAWVAVLAGYAPTPSEEMPVENWESGGGAPAASWEPNPTTPARTAASATPQQTQSNGAGNTTVDPNAEPDIRPKSKKSAPSEPEPARQGEVVTDPPISEAQAKRFFAIMRSAELTDEEVKARLAKLGYTGHRDKLPKRMYEAAIDAVDPDFRFHQKK